MEGIEIIPKPLKFHDLPVWTSEMVGEVYGVSPNCIKNNFDKNRSKFVEGKDYVVICGGELRSFCENQIENLKKKPPSLVLWTKTGLLFHAKYIRHENAEKLFKAIVYQVGG